jgi:hypothetical protein
MAASVKHTVLIVDDESVIASQTGFFFAWSRLPGIYFLIIFNHSHLFCFRS